MPFAAKLITSSTAATTDYDAPNPGTIIIGFKIKLPPNTNNALNVFLLPEKAEHNNNEKFPRYIIGLINQIKGENHLLISVTTFPGG